MPDWQSEMKAAKTKECCQSLLSARRAARRGLVRRHIVMSPSRKEERFKAESHGLSRCLAGSLSLALA